MYTFGWCLFSTVVLIIALVVICCARMASRSDRLEEEYLAELTANKSEQENE